MAGTTFRVHPQNPRCFLFKGKAFKVVTSGEHYGAVLNGDFDYDAYLREMQRTGENMTRAFTFYRETELCIPAPGAMNTLAPRPEAAVMPWERATGRGKAADGLDKFDLDRWNPKYFARLKDFVAKCDRAGVVCEIVLFCNPYDQKKYDLFPCSRASNVNGVGEDLPHFSAFMTLDAPSITAFQERFVRKIAEELNPFDNVYYEICNEPGVQRGPFPEAERKNVDWHLRLARVLRDAEARLPKRHLVAANAYLRVETPAAPDEPNSRHDDQAYFEHPDIDIVNYHYISAKANARGLHFLRLPSDQGRAGLIWAFLRQRDRFAKPIVFDETFSGVVRGKPERYAINRAEAWETILSGGAGYDNLDWSFTPADETGSGQAPIGDGRRLDGRCLRDWFRILRTLLAEYEIADLVPAVGLLPSEVPGYGAAALTDQKGAYLLYLVDERVHRLETCEARSLDVPLSLPAGDYAVEALDPRTGRRRELPRLKGDGAATLAIPPFAEDVAVILKRR